MKCCPACGQTLPPDTPSNVRLTPVQNKIFQIIRKAGKYGISRDEVHKKAYADDIDGGPEWGNVISVHVNRINKRLKPANMKIIAEQGRGSSGYMLVEVCK